MHLYVFFKAWRGVNYHNAVIACRESDVDCNAARLTTNEGKNEDDFKVYYIPAR